jgi:dolichol-phosphate mannosyltransferase
MTEPQADPIAQQEGTDRLHRRAAEGMKKPHNWIQLIKFGAVGASGYVVNLIVYYLCVHQLDVHYMLAAVIAFLFAVTNNFWWNRHWTFDAGHGHAGFQATRFFVVSLVALAFNLVLLKVLVVAGMKELPAQAIAIVCVTPVNFIGNKLWSFRD